MSLIFGSTSGFIISKIGSFKVILAGAIITTIGFLSILLLHTSAIQIALNLAVIGSGLSLLNVGQINVNTTSTPIKFIGISFGVNTLFRFIGSAIGPAIWLECLCRQIKQLYIQPLMLRQFLFHLLNLL